MLFIYIHMSIFKQKQNAAFSQLYRCVFLLLLLLFFFKHQPHTISRIRHQRQYFEKAKTKSKYPANFVTLCWRKMKISVREFFLKFNFVWKVFFVLTKMFRPNCNQLLQTLHTCLNQRRARKQEGKSISVRTCTIVAHVQPLQAFTATYWLHVYTSILKCMYEYLVWMQFILYMFILLTSGIWVSFVSMVHSLKNTNTKKSTFNKKNGRPYTCVYTQIFPKQFSLILLI